MNTALLVFGITMGVYFIGLIVFSIIKYFSAKKKVTKEIKENESQKQDNDVIH